MNFKQYNSFGQTHAIHNQHWRSTKGKNGGNLKDKQERQKLIRKK